MRPAVVRLLGGVASALALAIAAGGCGGNKMTGPSGTAATPANFDFGSNDSRRVTAFGDSITLGVLEERTRSSVLRMPRAITAKLLTDNNYPNLLEAMLRGLDPAWRVINRGAGGERTPAGLKRFPGVLAADHPGFVLIMEGTNDASEGDDPALIVANLEAMVTTAQANQTIPILGTIPPDFRNDPGAQAIIDQANAMIRTAARVRRIVLAEIFDGMNDRSLFGQAPDRDPLHPNEQGYAVMAGIWFDAMQKAIPPPPKPQAAPPPSEGVPPHEVGLRVKRP